MARSPSSYVDNAFYKNEMHEDKENEKFKNFPIKMSALRVDWIMEEEGKQFLQACLQSENQDIFRSKTIMVITEFLYMHYRQKVLTSKFPIYIIQLVIYFMSVLMPASERVRIVADGCNIVACIYSMGLLIMNLKYVGLIVFNKPWVYFDIFYIVILSGISGNHIHIEVYKQQMKNIVHVGL